MAAIARAGAESRANLIEFQGTNAAENKGTGATIDSEHQRKVTVGGEEKGGSYCYKFVHTGAESALHGNNWFAGVTERLYYFRHCVKKEGTTGATRPIIRYYQEEGELLGSVEVTTADKLILKNGAGTEVASVTNGLNETGLANNNGYHVIEFAIWVHATEAGKCKGRYWVDGEEVHKNETTFTVAKAGKAPTGTRIGWMGAESSATLYFDDMGVNDETGAKNNERLGTGSVLGHLSPTADAGREGWKAGAGGTTEMYKAVDAPPEGVANASKTNTSQIYDNESSTTHFYEATLGNYSGLGIKSGDTINVVRAVSYSGRTTGNVTLGVKGVSNPEVTEETTSVTVTAGAFPTLWRFYGSTWSDEPSPTLGTAPVIKVRKATASTNIIHSCYMGMQVEWTPASTKTVEWKAALASASSLKAHLATEVKVGEVELEPLSEPAVRTGHKLIFKAKKSGGSGAVVLYTELMEGTTAITGEQEAGTLTTSLATYEVAISEANAKEIKNYAYPLSVRFWAYSEAGESVEVEIAELSMELPAGGVREIKAALTSESVGAANLELSGFLHGALTSPSDASAKLEAIHILKAALARPSVLTAKLNSKVEVKAALASKSVLTGKIITGTPTPFKPSRRPPLALDVEVETPEGFFRLAADSTKAKNRPSGLGFSTQRGDGFGTGNLVLPRQIFREYPDLNLLDTWRFIGHNGDIAYEGKLHSSPRTNDPNQQISIALVGWMTYMKSEPINPLVIDRRLGQWIEPSLERRAYITQNFNRLYGADVNTGFKDSGSSYASGISISSARITEGYTTTGESWFYGGGQPIGKLLYDYKQITSATSPDTPWTQLARLVTNDKGEGEDAGTNHHRTNATGQSLAATTNTRYYAFFEVFREATIEGDYASDDAFLNIAVVGNHGLELRGSSPEQGFYISDIIEYIGSFYPKLDMSGVQQNTFALTQAAWQDSPATGYDIIQQLDDLVLWETNVWENRKFHFEPVDYTTYDWVMSTEEHGVSVNFQGDSIESFGNGVVVTYTDFGGVTRILYPNEHEELRDEDEDNPANKHGENLWTSVTMPWQGLEAEALQFGRAYLGEFNRPKRPGSYRISGGYIHDSAGNLHQGWKVRSSDTILISNHPSDEARLITATSWDQDSKTLEITVDAPPSTLDAITARHALALESRNL